MVLVNCLERKSCEVGKNLQYGITAPDLDGEQSCNDKML